MDFNNIEKIYLKLLKTQNLLNNNISLLAKEYNLNSTELMIYLDVKTNSNTNLNDLCERLSIKKSTASKALEKLIKENHIISEINSKDQRQVSLRHIEFENVDLCKEELLSKTFNKAKVKECDLEKINLALDETIKILTNEN